MQHTRTRTHLMQGSVPLWPGLVLVVDHNAERHQGPAGEGRRKGGGGTPSRYTQHYYSSFPPTLLLLLVEPKSSCLVLCTLATMNRVSYSMHRRTARQGNKSTSLPSLGTTTVAPAPHTGSVVAESAL